jgi:hypothetical protein
MIYAIETQGRAVARNPDKTASTVLSLPLEVLEGTGGRPS